MEERLRFSMAQYAEVTAFRVARVSLCAAVTLHILAEMISRVMGGMDENQDSAMRLSGCVSSGSRLITYRCRNVRSVDA